MTLVTASRSFVGIEVARQLAAIGCSLRVIVSDAAEAQLFDNFPQVEVVQSGLHPCEPLDANFAGIDKAFVAIPSSADANTMEANLAYAAQIAGVKHLVRLSGDLIGADPPAYAQHEHARISLTFLGASVSYQALTVYLLRSARHDQLALYSEREIAPVDARDVAAVAVAALTTEEHRGKHYCVTGPETLTLPEIADKLSFATGVRVGDIGQANDCERDHKTRWRGWEMTVMVELGSAPDVSKANLGCAVRQITGREPVAFDDYAAEIAERCPIFKRST